MQQSERFDDLNHAIDTALLGFQANIWTALPGIISDYDATKGTVRVQPAVKGIWTALNGAQYWVPLPLLTDVPVVFMGGGGFVATFPIQQGDEVLIVFSSRCISGWWAQGGIQRQTTRRMHDLSDGFAIVGPRSQANLIPNVSPDTVQLRSLDGSTYFELASGQVANVVAPGGINLKGNVSVTGTVTATGEGTFNQIAVSTHTHSGVAPGGGTSGPPVA